MADVSNYSWIGAPDPVAANGTIELAGSGDINGLTVPQRVHLSISLTVRGDAELGEYIIYPHNGDVIFLAFPNSEFGVKVGRPSEEWPGSFYPSGGADQFWDEGAAQTGTIALNDVEGGDDEDPANWTGNFLIVRIPCWTMVLLRTAELTPGNTHTLDVYWTLDTTVTAPTPTGSGVPVIGNPLGDGAVPQLVQLPVGSSGGAGPYSKAMLVALAAEHGAADPNLAAAVALAESGGNPLAANTANTDGSRDDGLWQINSIHGYDPDWLHDPDNNAEAMMAISSGGTDWTPWVTYNNGAYLAFL